MINENNSSVAGRNDRFRSENGSALSMSLFFFIVSTGLYLTMHSAVSREACGVEVEVARTKSFVAAEGLAQVAEEELLQTIAQYGDFADAGDADPHLVLQGEFQWDDSQNGVWRIDRATLTNADGESEELPARTETDPETGIRKIIDTYDIKSTVKTPQASVTVVRRLEVIRMPLFQFLVFYSEDLEINPGPQMNLDGRVHSNGDIYVSAGTGLNVDSEYFRMSGLLHRHRKDSDSVGQGAVKIRDTESGNLVVLPDADDLDSIGVDSAWGLDSQFLGHDAEGDGDFDDDGDIPPFAVAAEEMFGGTLETGEHGVREFAHPELPTIQPFVERDGGGWVVVEGEMVSVGANAGTHGPSFFHNSADLVIVDNQVFDGEGNDVTALMPSGFLSETEIYDAREGGEVPVVMVNMGRLGDQDQDPLTFDPSPFYPSNGLVYAFSNDASEGERASSFVLTNGAELNIPQVWDRDSYGADSRLGLLPPSGSISFSESQERGLTLVSPSPVYIQGDFNTINKKSSAVIADTVNLLSNSWDSTKTAGQLPNASDTRFNVALVTGNQETQTGDYNGGFENLPRFHENWSGVDCRIRGSFVNLWRSGVATGKWQYGGDRYTAPIRNWGFDHDFDDELPPFTPMVVTTKAVGWEVRN